MKKRKPSKSPPADPSRREVSRQKTYRIEIRPAAAEFISSLTGKNLRLVSRKIDALANDPVPPHAKRLRGNAEFLRIRAGDYRVIYRVDENRVVVVIATVGHRKDVYKKLVEILKR